MVAYPKDFDRRFNTVVALGALFLGFSAILSGQIAATRTSAKRELANGFVQNTREFDGAGCSLWLPSDRAYSSERRIFLSDLDNHAAININGRDTALMLVNFREPKGEAKKGDRSSYRYRGEGVEVGIKFIVSGVCAPDDESCEVIHYDATITSRPAKRVLVSQGLCGS